MSVSKRNKPLMSTLKGVNVWVYNLESNWYFSPDFIIIAWLISGNGSIELLDDGSPKNVP